MAAIFLLPLIISIYLVIVGKRETAFLNVYLPSTILIPYYYSFRIPHAPVLSAGMGALLPIGLSLLIKPKLRWQFRRMDFLVLLYITSFGLSEVLKEYVPKDGMILFLQFFIEMVLAYVVGRQLIEPELRLQTIKRIVFLFMCLTPFIAYEYRFGLNPWLTMSQKYFHFNNVAWFVQLRGGKARVAASFGHAILAGILFMVAMALNYYLVQIYKRDKMRLGKWMSLLQKYRIPFILLPCFVFLTGSRMPMASSVLCFMFLAIPMFKSLRTGVTVMLLLIVVGGGSVYYYVQQYTSVAEGKATDEAQTSAIYRKEMAEEYAPILKEGGWLGWSALSHPSVMGLSSIDNNYLLIQLQQGYLGRYSFFLIVIESVLTLVICAARFREKESLFLVFSLMGAVIGIFVSLTTVYLGEQVPQVLFLLLGWSQSLQDTRVTGLVGARAASGLPEQKFRFKRVIA